MRNFFIILDGPMGSGKSTVTKILNKKLPRTAILSWDNAKNIITDFGMGTEDFEILLNIQKILVKNLINHNFNIILDGGFARSERMTPFIRIAKRHKYDLVIYQFTAPHKILLERVTTRPKFDWERKKISKATIIKNLHFHEMNKYRAKNVIEIDSYKLSPQAITKLILKNIPKEENFSFQSKR